NILVFDKEGARVPKKINTESLQEVVEVYHLEKDKDQNVWAATSSGLFGLTNGSGKFKKISFKSSEIDKAVVTTISQINSKEIFISTYENGIWRLEKRGERFFLEPIEGVESSSGTFAAAIQDYQGKVFVSHWGKSIQSYQKVQAGLKHIKDYPFPHLVYEMEQNPDSTGIWIASAQGLFFLDYLKDSILVEKLFADRFISANSLVFDRDGHLWVSTDQGLVLYEDPQIVDQDYDSAPENHVKVFDVADGLPANGFNFKSFTKTHDGKLAFGSTNGYTLFDPKDITEYPVQARPTITQVLVNNKEVRGREKYGLISYQGKEIEELILEPGERTFTFRFSAMDYGDPQATQFEYRLRDRNGMLINRGNERFVRYFNLEQGEYNFELYASNSENVWNPEPRRLALRLKPYFYETPWFYALLLILGLMVMYAIYRNRTEHLRKKQQLTELENAILRIQMNPHFMFNSLNSIRAYLRSRDTKVASKYLKHLAKLMRKVLDIAKESEISIKEDLVFLTEHMEAEKIRFEDSFSYEIVMDEGVEAEEVMIPTMMLQPFVENAIIHAFKRNSKGGLLTLRYRIEGKQLICEVGDNGIGRQATATQRPEDHKSKATEITLQRLALIREKTGEPASLEIIDLFDSDNEPAGTRVEIRLPLNQKSSLS
ncbi:MAG: histidine kinase, partial [Bacteroidota bacterium]